MEGIGFILFIIFFIVPIIKSAKKKASSEDYEVERDSMPDRRITYNYERFERQRRMGTDTTVSNPNVTVSEEGYGLDSVPATPNVAPTVHIPNDSADCEAHTPPISSEGSDVRAHVRTEKASDCRVHTEPVSSEGESRAERIRRKKALEIRDRMQGVYAKKKNSKTAAAVKKMRFDNDTVVTAMLYGEILGKPKCRQ